MSKSVLLSLHCVSNTLSVLFEVEQRGKAGSRARANSGHSRSSDQRSSDTRSRGSRPKSRPRSARSVDPERPWTLYPALYPALFFFSA